MEPVSRAQEDPQVLPTTPKVTRVNHSGKRLSLPALTEQLKKVDITSKKAQANSDPSGQTSPTRGRTPRFFTPRLERKTGGDLKDLIRQLNGSSEQDKLLHSEIFSPIQERLNSECFDLAALKSAISDLWRDCHKVILFDKTNIKHTADRNGQFHALFRAFYDSHKIDFELPDTGDWKSMEQAEKWIEGLYNSKKITDCFARFIRSCSQARYSGDVAVALVTKRFGRLADLPIEAHIPTSQMVITRIFNENGTNREALQLPITIYNRNKESVIATINWGLWFFYDDECKLTSVNSTAIEVKD